MDHRFVEHPPRRDRELTDASRFAHAILRRALLQWRQGVVVSAESWEKEALVRGARRFLRQRRGLRLWHSWMVLEKKSATMQNKSLCWRQRRVFRRLRERVEARRHWRKLSAVAVGESESIRLRGVLRRWRSVRVMCAREKIGRWIQRRAWERRCRLCEEVHKRWRLIRGLRRWRGMALERRWRRGQMRLARVWERARIVEGSFGVWRQKTVDGVSKRGGGKWSVFWARRRRVLLLRSFGEWRDWKMGQVLERRRCLRARFLEWRGVSLMEKARRVGGMQRAVTLWRNWARVVRRERVQIQRRTLWQWKARTDRVKEEKREILETGLARWREYVEEVEEERQCRVKRVVSTWRRRVQMIRQRRQMRECWNPWKRLAVECRNEKIRQLKWTTFRKLSLCWRTFQWWKAEAQTRRRERLVCAFQQRAALRFWHKQILQRNNIRNLQKSAALAHWRKLVRRTKLHRLQSLPFWICRWRADLHRCRIHRLQVAFQILRRNMSNSRQRSQSVHLLFRSLRRIQQKRAMQTWHGAASHLAHLETAERRVTEKHNAVLARTHLHLWSTRLRQLHMARRFDRARLLWRAMHGFRLWQRERILCRRRYGAALHLWARQTQLRSFHALQRYIAASKRDHQRLSTAKTYHETTLLRHAFRSLAASARASKWRRNQAARAGLARIVDRGASLALRRRQDRAHALTVLARAIFRWRWSRMHPTKKSTLPTPKPFTPIPLTSLPTYHPKTQSPTTSTTQTTPSIPIPPIPARHRPPPRIPDFLQSDDHQSLYSYHPAAPSEHDDSQSTATLTPPRAKTPPRPSTNDPPSHRTASTTRRDELVKEWQALQDKASRDFVSLSALVALRDDQAYEWTPAHDQALHAVEKRLAAWETIKQRAAPLAERVFGTLTP